MSRNFFPVFYPIVPNVALAKEYIDAGITFLQIRIKDTSLEDVRQQLSEIVPYAKQNRAVLVINDYWELALELKADYIHLGQEDLASADIHKIQKSSIPFGISTHDLQELDIALAVNPSYIALGPLYPTQLKKMKWKPQGLEVIKIWKQKINRIPLVGIGGITLEKAEKILEAGCDSVSVVTDITLNENRSKRLEQWMAFAKKFMQRLG